MANSGVQIAGMCNGVSSYTSKNNQEYHQLLVVVPGSQGVIQIGLPSKPAPEQYPVGKAVSVSVIPTFYNGRISGFSINQ